MKRSGQISSTICGLLLGDRRKRHAFPVLLLLGVLTIQPIATVEAQVNGWGNLGWDNRLWVPTNALDAVSLAAGYLHALALRRDRTAVAWGYGDYGQLNIPPGLSNVVAIGSGVNHSLAVRSDGTVAAWGMSTYGAVPAPSYVTNAVAVAGGYYHSLALNADGTVIAWGFFPWGGADFPVGLRNVVAIAGGGFHSLALRLDGTVSAWGENFDGQCNVPGDLTNTVAIAGGMHHSLALRANGTVAVWGWVAPTPPGLTNIVAVAAGNGFNLALRKDGKVLAWGDNSSGQTNVPSIVTNITAITAGLAFGMAAESRGIPIIFPWPTNLTAIMGSTAYLRVNAAGSWPLRYQWRFNLSDIPGATNANLVLTNVLLGNAGDYTVIVSNSQGSVTSSIVHLGINVRPTVSLLSPTNGAFFVASSNVVLEADARDADGGLVSVEFFRGSTLLGAKSNSPFALVWSNVPSGRYALTARATDNQGATSVSPANQITVLKPPTNSCVRRVLPAAYAPGYPLQVRLHTAPSSHSSMYFVEELPPTGWNVGFIDNGGVLDEESGKLLFGPYSDNAVRLLSYGLTPPAGEEAVRAFVGKATVDGWPSSVGGDGLLSRAPRHPAECNSTNDTMTQSEVNDYAQAWKYGSNWACGPIPIPIDYVTRAGALWNGGGSYRFDPEVNSPPLWWINVEETNTISADLCAAHIDMPASFSPGLPFTLIVQVTPETRVTTYAVEQLLPHNWLVGGISNDGLFDTAKGKVKWGPFFDNSARVLTCQVTPASEAAGAFLLYGIASFDGWNVSITGQRLTCATMPVGSRTNSCVIARLAEGEYQLDFLCESNRAYVIEFSDDLITWTGIGLATSGDTGILRFTDLADSGVKYRFYRLRRSP